MSAENTFRTELILSGLQSFIDNYQGLDFPKGNISEGLKSVRTVYDADIAFILVIDSEVGAFRMISAELREGLEGFEDVLTRKVIARNLFAELVLPDKPVCFTAEQLFENHQAEYEWMNLNGVTSVMLSPILTRAMMKAFVGVCNIGRLFEDFSMLTFSTFMMTNEVRAVTILEKYAQQSNRLALLEDNDIIVNMFGGIEIWTRNGRLDLGNASEKCCLLLIYLVFNKDRFVPARELAEILWPEQLFDNPYNMIKGVAFRLKKLLDPVCEKKIVIAKQGTYALNSELYLLLDTDGFEKVYNSLKNKPLTSREKQTLYKRAISLYKGNLLPNFGDELWLVGKINHFQIMFSRIIKEYLLFLDKSGDVEEFFSVVSKVLNIIYPDGEIYNLILTMLVRQNRMDMARNCYLKIEKLLSPEQKQVFLNMWNKLEIK